MTVNSHFQRSWFSTGFFAAFFQPFRCHPSIHFCENALTKYAESEYSVTLHGCLSAVNP